MATAKSQQVAAWRKANPELHREHTARYREKHRGSLREKGRARDHENRDRNRPASSARGLRRARIHKTFLVKMLGGKCVLCGLEGHPAIYDFDHVDPATKLFDICSRIAGALSGLLSEVAKCQLLCANCHRMKSVKDDWRSNPSGY